jgi:hypothetical protein
MSHFLIAPVARMELDEIWDYYAIEPQNPDAADRIREMNDESPLHSQIQSRHFFVHLRKWA